MVFKIENWIYPNYSHIANVNFTQASRRWSREAGKTWGGYTISRLLSGKLAIILVLKAVGAIHWIRICFFILKYHAKFIIILVITVTIIDMVCIYDFSVHVKLQRSLWTMSLEISFNRSFSNPWCTQIIQRRKVITSTSWKTWEVKYSIPHQVLLPTSDRDYYSYVL